MMQKQNLPLEGAPVTDEKHVLIIEDDHEMSKLLQEKFEQAKDYSFQVEIAKDKEEGMSSLEKEKYAVIVIDRLLLGEWTELALLRHHIHDAVSIVWTAYFEPDSPTHDDMENLKECMRLGAWDYVPKRAENTFALVVGSATKGLRKLERQRSITESLSQESLSRLLQEAEKKHRGKWIAIRGEEILAVAENRMRLIDAVDIKEQEPIIIKIPSTLQMFRPEDK